jgi:hypothetical protein
MTYLIYPTLDLYLYDLRDGLGQDPGEEIETNKQYFAKKLPQNIRPSILENDHEFEAEYVELLGDKITEDILQDTPHFEGYYYPVRLSDTYGLLLDCSLKDEAFPHSVHCLESLKTIIDDQLKNEVATLGQTWLIYGQLPVAKNVYPTQTPEAVAQECYQTLIPGADWETNLQGTDNFLGGTICELWRYRLNISEKVSPTQTVLQESCLTDNHHVVIILYPDQECLDKSADFITDWMRLFCYRHKIMYAYNQSRLLKHNLKNDLIEIQKYVRRFHSKNNFPKLSLAQLQKELEKAEELFSRYGINLTYLNYQTSTLEINLYNYRSRLLAMQKKLEAKEMPSSLETLKEFSRYAKQKYLAQVQKDYENLSAGLKLLEGAVNLIRAEVEVDRSTRDRNFQEVVGFYGVAFAAGSIIAGISSQFTTPPSQESIKMAREQLAGVVLSKHGIPDEYLPLSISLFYTVAIYFFVFFILVLMVVPLWQWLNRRH